MRCLRARADQQGPLRGDVPLPVRRRAGPGVPVRVGRRLACSCQGADAAKSCTVLELGKDALSPELAYVTARYAALAPFGKVAALLSELLPLGGTQHASTVR